MTYATVLADSIAYGSRLITLELKMPRIILDQFNTHRMLSRNTASLRALSLKRVRDMVESDPFIPKHFGSEQRGMVPGDEPVDQELANRAWLIGLRDAVETHKELESLRVHKQIANRVLTPYLWSRTIATGNERWWADFIRQRSAHDAQGEIAELAECIRTAINASVPLKDLDWHLPFIDRSTWVEAESLFGVLSRSFDSRHPILMISAGRCARVSYLSHDGKRDVRADVDLAKRLIVDGHMTPFEHQAQVAPWDRNLNQNFDSPWNQYRKVVEWPA